MQDPGAVLLVAEDEVRRTTYRRWFHSLPSIEVREATSFAAMETALDAALPTVLLLDAALITEEGEALMNQLCATGGLPEVLLLADPGLLSSEERLHRLPEACDLLPTDGLTPPLLRRTVARLVGRHHLSESLRSSQAERLHLEALLESYSATQTALLAQKRHDLRSPLNALLGYAELLGEELRDHNLQHLDPYIDKIRSVISRMVRIISTLGGPPQDALQAASVRMEAESNGHPFSAEEQDLAEPEPPPLALPDSPILIIDDDQEMRELMARFLESEGYRSAIAVNGQEGVEMARRLHPAAITLDLHMPELDGWGVLDRLKQDATLAHIPIIMLTGRGSERVAARALNRGVDDYLIKGEMTALALRRAVRGVLEKDRLRRGIQQAQQDVVQANEALRRLNETLEERVEEQTDQIRALASSLTLAEQEERERISGILHDHLQQLLVGIKMTITQLAPLESPEKKALLERSVGLVQQAYESARTLSVELNPPVLDEHSLTEVIAWLAMQMQDLYNLEVDVQATANVPPLRREIRLLLIRLVRELLFNVVKHAGVSSARVVLTRTEGRLVVQVEDDGNGFDPAELDRPMRTQGGLGLSTMAKRLSLFKGSITVVSAPGAGSRMTLSFPEEVFLESPEIASE